ncbi:MAG: FtsQ-type POTRA domain-containing protein [Ilumatobacteraceae bacterium]
MRVVKPTGDTTIPDAVEGAPEADEGSDASPPAPSRIAPLPPTGDVIHIDDDSFATGALDLPELAPRAGEELEDPFGDPFALDAELSEVLSDVTPPDGGDLEDAGGLDPLLAAPPTGTADATAPLRFRRRPIPDPLDPEEVQDTGGDQAAAGDQDPADPQAVPAPETTGDGPAPGPSRLVIIDDDVIGAPTAGPPRSGSQPGALAGAPRDAPVPRPVDSTAAGQDPPGRLVIGDDDLDDLGAIEERDIVRTDVPMDPRLRRRRIDVRRAQGRRRLVAGIGIGAAVALVVGALIVLASPVFSVRNVDVYGAVYTSQEDIDAILTTIEGHPILTLDTDAVAAEFEALPWVRAARVQADFPSHLQVELAERAPVATYRGGDARWRVIDREGRVIAIIANGAQPADYLPIVGSGPGPDVEAGDSAGDLYRVAGELALALPEELRVATREITLDTDLGEIGLVLTTDTTVSFGPPNDLRAKLARLITLLREHPPAELSDVQLSDPGNPGFTEVG